MPRSTLTCRYCRQPATTIVRATGGTGQLVTTSYPICDRDTCATKSNQATKDFAHRDAQTIPETDRAEPTDTPGDQPSLF
jgi:hypothetical protein